MPCFAQNWDINTLREINHNRNPHFDQGFQFVSDWTGPAAVAVPALLFAVGYISKDSSAKHHAIEIASTLVIASVLTTSSKWIIQRERPFISYPDIEKIGKGGSYSMPSGHTSNAFALATSLSLTYPKWYIIAPSFVWAGAVGYSRMHLGVHYPSDVLVGALVGAGSAFLSQKLNKWLFRPKSKISKIHWLNE